jgi:hypothetical protein
MRERSVGLDLGLCLKRFGSTGNNGSTESRTLATGAIIAKKECANKPFGLLAAFASELIAPQPTFRN